MFIQHIKISDGCNEIEKSFKQSKTKHEMVININYVELFAFLRNKRGGPIDNDSTRVLFVGQI